MVLVNSNPATIMTDPGMADATYIEPITPEFVEKIIARERPNVPPGKVFALLPTMGGQTALNTALSLRKRGVLEKYDVELIGASRRGHRQGRRPRAVPPGDDEDRPRRAARHHAERLSAPQEGFARQLPLRRSEQSGDGAVAGGLHARAAGARPGRPARRDPALASRWAAPAAASPTTARNSSRSSSGASTPRRPTKC